MRYSVDWNGEHVILLDQSLLPSEERYIDIRTVGEMADAIRTMKVRGAPAIGVAAAYGAVLATLATEGEAIEKRTRRIEESIDELAGTRPTAVNLFAALDRMRERLHASKPEELSRRMLDAARGIHEHEIRATKSISTYGASLIPEAATVLTHCNAGMIATAAYGTAIGAIVEAHRQGRVRKVFATETRPLCQGARLTVWELTAAKIPTTLITDSMVAHIMATCRMSCVIVGADRIAANGDVANKIGTYGIAVIARAHGVPFYVAAPTTTIDPAIPSGLEITIEERNPLEVTHGGSVRIAAAGCETRNPAFDITPNSLVSAIVTERGIIRNPDEVRLRDVIGTEP